jgi:hypothetical protein
MKHCNFPWFAEIFSKMMIHYSLAIPTVLSSSSRLESQAVSTVSPMNGSLSTVAQAPNPIPFSGMAENNATLKSISTDRPVISFASAVGNCPSPADMQRQLKLEERLGVGGIGGRSQFTAKPTKSGRGSNSIPSRIILAPAGNVHNSTGEIGSWPTTSAPNRSNFSAYAGGMGSTRTKRSLDALDKPGSSFPGSQQFFFRFIIMADSHRFTEHLQEELCRCIFEEGVLGNNNSLLLDKEAGRDSFVDFNSRLTSEPLSVRILKLRLLGKFLGLVEFWHHWTLDEADSLQKDVGLTKPGNPTGKAEPAEMDNLASLQLSFGPLLRQAQERAQTRSLFRKVLPVQQLLDGAIAGRYLTVTVPWIVEFLSMLEFDKCSHIENPYKDVMSTLLALQKCELTLTNGQLTQNR